MSEDDEKYPRDMRRGREEENRPCAALLDSKGSKAVKHTFSLPAVLRSGNLRWNWLSLVKGQNAVVLRRDWGES